MVLKRYQALADRIGRFENDVEMYGAQTLFYKINKYLKFENDVEMYGAQTVSFVPAWIAEFENDVEMYGAQTRV